MPDGIIYIARNNSNPENHYKIGKSYRIDPVHRMRELTSETTNYEDEFISLGHAIVSNVDECEIKIHENLSNYRINPRREFFNIKLNEAAKLIRASLNNEIILDKLPNNECENLINLKVGDKKIYHDQKHLLNFISKDEIMNLNFYTICKYADFHNWHWYLCHGDYCCRQLRHAFYVLLNKINFINAYSTNPIFTPRLDQTDINSKNITKDEKIRLQNYIKELKLKDYLNEIKFPNNLGYIGVAMFIIGEELEKENRSLTKHLIPQFIKLFPNQFENIKKLEDIYYNNKYLTCWSLGIIEEMILKDKSLHN